jgi:hypothetical protein
VDYKSLSKFTYADIDKEVLINSVLYNNDANELKMNMMADYEPCFYSKAIEDTFIPSKFCPKCHKKYPSEENFCLKCGVALKDIKDVDINQIQLNPKFRIKGNNHYDDFNDILTVENLEKININSFDINAISEKIRRSAIRRLDRTIKKNDILLDDLSVLEKIMLFCKSFVNVEYKSYGPELGYYEFNKIYIDDRQLDVLQITTLIHELTHFLNKEILSHALCQILDCDKTSQIESIVTFILSYSPLNQLVDEYAAHTVEGRFTLYGFQDYSSFLNIQNSIDIADEEIEMLKTIGNTFAIAIKHILESFINADLLKDIKNQFKSDIMDQPDYKNLALENCTLLNKEGLTRAVRFILYDGFAVAMDNIDTLEQYNINLE